MGSLRFVLRTMIHVGVPIVLIFIEPDLSTCIMYIVIWLVVMWAAGLRWQHLAIFGGATAALLPVGFFGAIVVILLMAFIVYRIFHAGQTARDTFGSLLCYGIGSIILYQAFFNIGMNMNLLPVTGLPLPFVSYGGSSLWTFIFGIGLVESVILRHKQIEF